MPSNKAAWGIEVGANAIKAIRLEREGEEVTVSDFAVIPHRKVLSTPDLDQDEMVRLSLGQFISQQDLEKEHLVMSVPGHTAFARFAKLPPVEPKKVPDIVKFEAVQQIPFPIDEVEWDYETFASEDSPEIEVGIFAITKERIQQQLSLYNELGLTPESITLSPLAVYNAVAYDSDLSRSKEPVLYLDIGTHATDVVIAEEGRCWIRTFPLGGTHFTEAIASSFKLSYSKAEKLKQEAATSKYAKQIMQAMRPVFSDLLQDLQRSIGYYQSMHQDNELKVMVGLGSTFKIPGLRKFLGQQLQINVVRLDEFKRLSVTGREAASFSEHAVNMATAYGLALQGIGLSSISANLMPVPILRQQVWRSKTKWFAAAAAVAVAGSAFTLYRPLVDGAAISGSGPPPIVQTTLSRGQQLQNEFQQIQQRDEVGAKISNMMELTDHRHIWPHLISDTAEALRSTNPQPELLSGDLEAIRSIPPEERRLAELRRLEGTYSYENGQRRVSVLMDVRVSQSPAEDFTNETIAAWLRANADREDAPYVIDMDKGVSVNPESIQTIHVSEGQVSEPDRVGPRDRRDRRPGDRRGGGRLPGGGPSGGPSGGPPRGPGGGPSGGPSGPMPPSGPSGGGPQPPDRFPGGSGGPGGPGGPGGGPGPRPPRGGQGDRSGGADVHGNLEQMAPIPSRPMLYPVGSEYYLVPITFDIILREPDEQSRR